MTQRPFFDRDGFGVSVSDGQKTTRGNWCKEYSSTYRWVSFAALSDPHPEAATVLGLVVVLCGWNALAFAWARGAMRSDVRAGLEPA